MELGMHPAISCSRRSLVAPMRGELPVHYTPLREGRVTAATAEPTHFWMAAISHAGVLVPDVERAAKVFGEWMGIPGPKANADAGMVFPKGFSGDPSAHLKIVSFRLRSISVEYAEPQGGKSLWCEHLDAFGPSMHHLAVAVRRTSPTCRARVESSCWGPDRVTHSSTSSPSHSDSLSS